MMWLIAKPNYTRETPRGLTCMNPPVLDSKAVLDCTQTLGDNTYDTEKFVGSPTSLVCIITSFVEYLYLLLLCKIKGKTCLLINQSGSYPKKKLI